MAEKIAKTLIPPNLRSHLSRAHVEKFDELEVKQCKEADRKQEDQVLK